MTDAGWGMGKTLVRENERVSLGKSSDEALVAVPLEPRYQSIDMLGEGGMGEVRLVRDTVVGRDVALKRVRGAMGLDAQARERFVREARIQGQLEHPSIVPVYDLAMTEDRRLFFTMRRVRGHALDELALGGAKPTRRALLAAMSRVCLAVDFAHSRGVLHRDIKPANLMLGDYGEVYVLDWGLAKLASASPDPASPSAPSSVAQADTGAHQTTVGSVLGTPGYMAPEQVRGEAIDERADVFALGACLFELLAEKPLIEGKGVQEILVGTVAGANAKLSERAPERDVPVELEEICVRATQAKREERFQTARAMSDAIERYLEGDRDLERRRAKASEHAGRAMALVETAFGEGQGAESARKEAMREVVRALTNDPDNGDARRVLMRLLTEPPRVAPREVEAEMTAERERSIPVAERIAALALLSTLVPQVFAAWGGVRDMRWFAVGVLIPLVAAAAAAMPPKRFVTARRFVVAGIVAVGLVAGARVASPFIVMPTVALAFGAGLALFPRRTSPVVAAVVTLGCIALPVVLELSGALPPTVHLEGGRVIIDTRVVHWTAESALTWFFVATTMPVIAMCSYLAHLRDRLLEAERRTRLQAWQLRHILPDEGP